MSIKAIGGLLLPVPLWRCRLRRPLIREGVATVMVLTPRDHTADRIHPGRTVPAAIAPRGHHSAQLPTTVAPRPHRASSGTAMER